MRKYFLFFVFFLVIVLFVVNYLIVSHFSLDKLNGVKIDDVGLASSPMRVDLSISKAPIVGEIVEIVVSISYIIPIKEGMPNTESSVILPEGFELVSGSTSWEGALQEKSQFSIVVRSVKSGNWTIEATARNPPTGDTWFGGKDFVYVSVGDSISYLQDEPFPENRQCPAGVNCTSGVIGG